MALSLDLRGRVMSAYKNEEGSIRKLAKRFKISPSTIWELLKRYEKTGHLEADSPPGRKPITGQQEVKVLEKLLKKYNDLTLSELQKRLKEQTGTQVSITTIHRLCQQFEWRYKKNSISS